VHTILHSAGIPPGFVAATWPRDYFTLGEGLQRHTDSGVRPQAEEGGFDRWATLVTERTICLLPAPNKRNRPPEA